MTLRRGGNFPQGHDTLPDKEKRERNHAAITMAWFLSLDSCHMADRQQDPPGAEKVLLTAPSPGGAGLGTDEPGKGQGK